MHKTSESPAVDGNGADFATELLCRAAVLAALNRQSELADCIALGLEQGLQWNAFYETFLQCYLFAGFPAAIEALSTLAQTLEALDIELPVQVAAETDTEHFRQRGEALCQKIYAGAYAPMRKRFGRIAPDLDQWMILEGYGKTLSRPGLALKTRELITVAILAALGWERQLFSHIRGALFCGASFEECRMAAEIAPALQAAENRATAQRILHTVWEKYGNA